MEKAELKNVLAIGVLVLMAAWVIYTGTFVSALGWPGITAVKAETAKLQIKRKELQTRVSNAQEMVKNLDKIKQERAALEAQLKEISKKLPGERESAQVLRSVESLAGKAGLTLAGVKRRPVRTQEFYAEIPMDVGVGGGYHDLVRFADQLAQLDRLVTLSEVQIQRPAVQAPGPAAVVAGPSGSIKANMVAVVFQALPEPSDAPAVSTPGAPPVPARPAVAPAR
jgi:type IV pilus assembly protein PilO